MKYCFSRLCLWLCLFVCFIFVPNTYATTPDSEPDKQPILSNTLITQKTLTREFDPMVITGDLLPMMDGFKIENFRLFAHDGSQLQVIPFQIDERNPDGRFIFTHGEASESDVDNGLFDFNDELVFMARDAGGQIAYEEWTKLSNKGVEVLITDPLDISKKGWVYLIYFPENPPALSEKDYISFTKGGGKEVIQSEYYTMAYKEGAPFYSDLSYSEANGGNGEDFFDRIKIRIKVKALFNILSITKTEADMRDKVIGWKDGPVRAMRYAQSFFRILFDLAEPSMTSINEYYATLARQPVTVNIPFNLKWVFSSFSISNFDWIFYGDLHGLKGGKAYTNKNLGGFLYTGKHPGDSFTKNIDQNNLVWGIAAKEGVGTWFPCLILPELLYGVSKFYAVDDDTLSDPPEDVPGVIGAGLKIGMADVNKDLWSVLLKGSYQMALETYFPRTDMKIEKIDDWLNIRGFPLSIDVDKEHGKEIVAACLSPQKDMKAGDKKGKKEKSKEETFRGVLTDIRGREFSLNNIANYFGSAEVTPRTYVGGKTGTGKKTEYFLMEFKDIERIEHHIEKIDPITGMKNPMFQKLIMNDGEIHDMLGCKPCGFGGELDDGKKIFFWNTQVRSIDFEKITASKGK